MARRAHSRSVAAKKGWATRRARGRARSKAAKRGWKTRRARGRARSKAAKRGWKTRRKHEGKSPTLRTFLFPFPYKHGTRKPSFVVVAIDQEHAEAALESHLERLAEDENTRSSWLQRLTWSKVVDLGQADAGARSSVRKRL